MENISKKLRKKKIADAYKQEQINKVTKITDKKLLDNFNVAKSTLKDSLNKGFHHIDELLKMYEDEINRRKQTGNWNPGGRNKK